LRAFGIRVLRAEGSIWTQDGGNCRRNQRELRWAGHVTRKEDMRNAYNIFVGKPGGKRPLGRPRRRMDGNIRMDVKEAGWEVADLIRLRIETSGGIL
jgi:hypothetical protein